MGFCGGSAAQVSPETAAEAEELPEATEADKSHPDNKAIVLEPDFGGPCKKRRCTDVLCILVLVACWVVMSGIGFAALGWIDSNRINKGNPYRLVNGMDYKGNICGFSKDTKDEAKLYYLPDGQGVCVKKCPKTTNIEDFICRYNVQRQLDEETTYAVRVAKGLKYVRSMECSVVYATKDVLNYCVADEAIDMAEELADAEYVTDAMGVNMTETGYASNDDKKWYEKVYGDIFIAYPYILGFGIGGALVVGFVYTFVLRIPGVLSLIIWSILFAILMIAVVAGAWFYSVSKKWANEEDPKTHTKSQADTMLYTSYVCFVLAGLWFCMICCLRKRIMLAIGIVKEAAKCIATMPVIVLFPIVQMFGLLIFLVPWFIYCLFLGSSGEMKVHETAAGSYREMNYDNNTFYAGWFMLFSYFWTSEWIVAIGQLIIAMAVSTWYFTRDKGTIGSLTVVTSFRRSIYYHTGTAAFGSLIIAIIKTIRAIVAYIQKKAKRMKNFKVLVQVILCVIQCCLWCIEKCMKFINKNAYIQTAIFGYSFCKAARCAFFLILRNIARIGMLGLVKGFVLLLGTLIIAGGATLLCFFALSSGAVADKLNGVVVPVILTFILAWTVASMFNSVWGMSMSTILQCFVADEEMYKSDKDAMYAGSALKSTINSSSKKGNKVHVKPAEGAQEAVPMP